VIKTRDKFSPPGSAGHGGVSRRPQVHRGLLKRLLVPNVAQALTEPDVTRKVERADAATPSSGGLEQGK
jgi:hypothetical protein